MDQKRTLLHHFLAALAYRTQKALRDAPVEFASFRAAPKVRTPHELIRHMDDVLGYARTYFIGGKYRAPEFPDFAAAIAHFHETLADLARHIETGTQFSQPTIALGHFQVHGRTDVLVWDGGYVDMLPGGKAPVIRQSREEMR